MTVDPTENSGYTLRCAELPAGASGSGSGRIDLRVVLYNLSSKYQHGFHENIYRQPYGPGLPSSWGSASCTSYLP